MSFCSPRRRFKQITCACHAQMQCQCVGTGSTVGCHRAVTVLSPGRHWDMCRASAGPVPYCRGVVVEEVRYRGALNGPPQTPSGGYTCQRRGMAQPGSASALGAEGRRFESCCPDHVLGFVPGQNSGAGAEFWCGAGTRCARSSCG